MTVAQNDYLCNCCELYYPLPPRPTDVDSRMHQTTGIPKRCKKCREHQGDDAETAMRRAEAHVKAYLVMYHRASDAAKRMVAEVQEANGAVSDYRDRMRSAYRSRDAATEVLAKIADLHVPTGRGCSCLRRDCETMPIVNRNWVRDRIRDLKARGWGQDDEWDATADSATA